MSWDRYFPEPPNKPPPPSPCEIEAEIYEYDHGPSLMYFCSVCNRWQDTYYGKVMDKLYSDILPQEPYIYISIEDALEMIFGKGISK